MMMQNELHMIVGENSIFRHCGTNVYHSVIRTTSSGRFLHVDLRDSMIIKKDWYENASENAQKWNLDYYY